MKIYPTFHEAILRLTTTLLTTGYRLKPNNWQSMDVSQRAEAEMIETLNQSFQTATQGKDTLEDSWTYDDVFAEMAKVGFEQIPSVIWKENDA